MSDATPHTKPKLLVILGAGSSVELGMPSVGGLAKSMKESASGWASELAERFDDAPVPDYFDLVWKNREKAMKQQNGAGWKSALEPNYERCLGDLHALMNGTLPSLRWASHSRALCRMVGISGRGHTQKRAVSSEVNSLLKDLLRKLEKCFRERCVEFECENGRQRSAEFECYCAFVAALRARFDLGVYNLNHDTVALTALGNIFTGFARPTGCFEAAEVQSRREWEFLYHLHGSVHFSLGRAEKEDEHIPASYDICWLADLEDGPCGQHRSVWLSTGSSDNRDVVASTLVAGGWKLDQLQTEPFQTFYSTLPRHAHEADAILIAGYGFGDEHVNSVLKNVLQAREGHRPPVMVLDFLKPEKRPLEGERSKGYEFVERTQSRWQSDVLTKLGMWDGVATLRHDFRRAKRLDQPLAEAEYAEEVRSEEYAVFFENAYPVAVWFGGFLAAADPGEEIANWLLGHVPGRSGM